MEEKKLKPKQKFELLQRLREDIRKYLALVPETEEIEPIARDIEYILYHLREDEDIRRKFPEIRELAAEAYEFVVDIYELREKTLGRKANPLLDLIDKKIIETAKKIEEVI